MKTLGMRHIALNVKNAQAAKAFYCKTLQMDVEWEPDPKSVYLSSQGQDNIALHQADAPLNKPGSLNHIGFFVKTIEEVDTWYAHIQACGAKIVKEIKTHRDGARSFYFEDLDSNVIQLLYHAPVSNHA